MARNTLKWSILINILNSHRNTILLVWPQSNWHIQCLNTHEVCGERWIHQGIIIWILLCESYLIWHGSVSQGQWDPNISIVSFLQDNRVWQSVKLQSNVIIYLWDIKPVRILEWSTSHWKSLVSSWWDTGQLLDNSDGQLYQETVDKYIL